MTGRAIRYFETDEAVRHIGERLIAARLPREEWTHEAHIAACLWILTERPDLDAARNLPAIIRRHNDSVGTANTDTSGFHATITHCYISGVTAFVHRTDVKLSLAAKVNALLAAAEGQRDWPLRLYSRERLFSVGARRAVILPDLEAVPE